MFWFQRKQLCLHILRDAIQISHENDQIRCFFQMYFQDLLEKFESKPFLELAEQKKNIQTINILIKVSEIYYNNLYKLYGEDEQQPSLYMTKEQAKEKLIADYFNSMKEGNDYIASMSMEEWISENKIIIVEQDFFENSSSNE